MAVPAWLVQSYCTFDSSQIAQALDWTYLNLDGADLQEAYGFALWYRPAMNRQNQLRVDRLGIKLAEQGGIKPVMQPPATMQGAPSMGFFGSLFGGDSQAGAEALSQQWAGEGAAMMQAGQQFGAYGGGGESYGGDPYGGAAGGGGFNWGGLLTPLIQAGAQIGSAAIHAANVPQATPYMPPGVTAPPNYYAPPSPYGAPMQQPQINPATGQPYINPTTGQLYPMGTQINPLTGQPYPVGTQINPLTGQPYPAGTQINPLTGQPYPMGTQINPMTGQPIYAAPSVIAAAQPMPQWLLPVGIAAGVGLLAFAMAK